MKLPNRLTSQELRVLQEYRRVEKDEMTEAEIAAITHPAGGGVEPARSLAEKGFLVASAEGAAFRLTERAKALLAEKPAPAGVEAEAASESA